MFLGAILGYLTGHGRVYLINNLKLEEVDTLFTTRPTYPIECELTGKRRCYLTEIVILDNSVVKNKRILEIGLPEFPYSINLLGR